MGTGRASLHGITVDKRDCEYTLATLLCFCWLHYSPVLHWH